MSLGYAYAGACALLTRTQCYLTREQWEKTSLRGAYALGNLEKMMPHHRFCLRHCLFSPSNMFAASAIGCEDEEELEVEEEEEELRDRGAMCFENFKNSSNDAVSLAPLQVRKGFCLRGHVGYYSKSQVQLTRCLRGAYAECGHSVGEL